MLVVEAAGRPSVVHPSDAGGVEAGAVAVAGGVLGIGMDGAAQ